MNIVFRTRYNLVIRDIKNLSNYTKKNLIKECERPVRQIQKTDLLWYPGHINRGIQKINQKMLTSDMIIEIHDARIPFTGRTEMISNLSQVKSRILVFNKVDLIPPDMKETILESVIKRSELSGDVPVKVFFTQLNDPGNHSKLLKEINTTILEHLSSEVIQTSTKPENTILIAGLPNVGKSTFINGLRFWNQRQNGGYAKKRSDKPVQVASHAGVTRSVSERILLCEGPPRLLVLDSPGIWEPPRDQADAVECMLKLAVCGCLNWAKLGNAREAVNDYLLYRLNRPPNYPRPDKNLPEYVRHYGLSVSAPVDSVLHLVQLICAAQGLLRQGRGGTVYPDVDKALTLMHTDFNRGLLGRLMLDDVTDQPESRALSTVGAVIPHLKPRSRPRIPFVFS